MEPGVSMDSTATGTEESSARPCRRWRNSVLLETRPRPRRAVAG